MPKICSKKIAKNYLVEFSNFPNLKLLMINISKFVDSVKIKVLKRQNLSSRCDLTGSLVHSDLSKNQSDYHFAFVVLRFFKLACKLVAVEKTFCVLVSDLKISRKNN